MNPEIWTRPPQSEGVAEVLRELVTHIREIDDKSRELNRELRAL